RTRPRLRCGNGSASRSSVLCPAPSAIGPADSSMLTSCSALFSSRMHWTRRTIPSRDEPAGEHNAGVPTMEQRRPRFRLSTLMLLIIIAGLTSALLVEQRRRRQLVRELAVTRSQLPRYTLYRARLRTAIKNTQKVPGPTSGNDDDTQDRASERKAGVE